MGMVTGESSKYCCLKIQQALEDITGVNNPATKERDTLGFTKALMSQENTSGFEQVQTDSARGKSLPDTGNREIEIKHRPRTCVATTESALDLCDAADASVDGTLYDRPTVDKVIATAGVRLNNSEFRDLCEDVGSRRMIEIKDHIRALKKGMNDGLLASAVAVGGVGKYFSEDGATSADSRTNPITLNLFTSTAQPNAMSLFPVVDQYQRMGLSGPIAIGGRTFKAWDYVSPIYSGNEDGRDVNRIDDVDVYVDYKLDTAWGDGSEHLLTFAPGYMQIMNWYRYVGDYEKFDDNWTKTVIDDNGFKFDFSVKYDECDDYWLLHFSKHYDLFKVPDTAFSTDCGQLHNGCLNWLVDCGDLSCDIFAGAPAS